MYLHHLVGREGHATSCTARSDLSHSVSPPAFCQPREVKRTGQGFPLVWKPCAGSSAQRGWQAALAAMPQDPGPAGCAERGGWHGIIVHQEPHSLFSFKMILMR